MDYTEAIAKKLFYKLKAFHNNRDFVFGVMCNVSSVEGMQVMMDYIDHGDDVTIENILLLSLDLCDNRSQD